jgi:hypothetical protein
MRYVFIAIVFFLLGGILFAEVPESTWKALLNSDVTITKTDGSEVSGRLSLNEATSVSVIKANGEVVTVPKKDVREVRGKVAMQASAGAGQPTVGWAPTAAVVGYVSAGLVVGLGVVTVITNGQETLPLVFGGLDLAFAILSFPIAAIGSSSALQGGVTGYPWLRITGWGVWGLTIVLGIVEIVIGVNEYIPNPLIISTVLSGAMALICISTDALINASEAQEAMKSTKERSGPRVAVLPLFSLTEKSEVAVGLRCKVWF